jgi:hypothetical protein
MAILWPTRPVASWLEGVGVLRARSSGVVKAAAQFLACLALVGAVACGGDDAHNGVGRLGQDGDDLHVATGREALAARA